MHFFGEMIDRPDRQRTLAVFGSDKVGIGTHQFGREGDSEVHVSPTFAADFAVGGPVTKFHVHGFKAGVPPFGGKFDRRIESEGGLVCHNEFERTLVWAQVVHGGDDLGRRQQFAALVARKVLDLLPKPQDND